MRAKWHALVLRNHVVPRIGQCSGAEVRLPFRQTRRHPKESSETEIPLEVIFFGDYRAVGKLTHEMAGSFTGTAQRAEERKPIRSVRMNCPDRPGSQISQTLGFVAGKHDPAILKYGWVQGSVE